MSFLDNVTKVANKALLKTKAHSPEILLAVGLAAGVGAIAMAIKSTTHLDEVVEDSKNDLDGVRETHEYYISCTEEEKKEQFTENYELIYKKDLTMAYLRTGGRFVKLYAPTLILGAISGTSILASHGIMSKRNLALTSAYGALDGAFKAYRGRVIEELGEEADKRFKYGVHKETVEEEVTDEKGKKKKVKKEIDVINEGVEGYSDYARFFDESSKEWEKNAEYNLMFLKAQQAYANDKLRGRGYLFLNEVYDLLGIERSRAGQSVGWIYDKENLVGDNFVDFGIYNYNKPNRAFINGYEPVILLDFNVDGPIIDRVWGGKKLDTPPFRGAKAIAG